MNSAVLRFYLEASETGMSRTYYVQESPDAERTAPKSLPLSLCLVSRRACRQVLSDIYEKKSEGWVNEAAR